MNKIDRQQTTLQRIHSMKDRPQEQVDHILAILEKERNIQVVSAALTALTSTTHAIPWEARLTLVQLYNYYDSAGIKRDAGGKLRAAILTVLLQIANLDDIALAERAVTTYEFMPPNREECAGELRTIGLTLLNRLDPMQANYHGVRLLNDPHTARMSGEPAITAAQFLADQRQILALYAFVLTNLRDQQSIPEVMAVCLKSLAEAPESIVNELIAQYTAYAPGTTMALHETKDDIELVGLFDMLVEHASESICLNFIKDFLQKTQRYEVYSYLVNIIIGSHQAEAWKLVLRIARGERDKQKVDILLSALSLAQNDPTVAKLIGELQKNNKRNTKNNT